MPAPRIPVHIEGGWQGTDMQLTVVDPHNNRNILELTIPSATFMDMLRNHHGYQPPLGELTLHRGSINSYGHEYQQTVLVVPDDGLSANTWDGWWQKHAPAGWTPNFGYSSHRHSRSEGTYKLGLSRHVPHGTKPEIEGHPDAEITVRWTDLATWGQR